MQPKGRCKRWTLDSGLDRGLDGGLDFGPNFWLSFGLVIITLARLFRLTNHRYALPVYGLAMSSSKLGEEASAIVIISDDTWVAFIKLIKKSSLLGVCMSLCMSS